MEKKQNFRYAALYNPETDTYCTDASQTGLIMGPETAKRFEENDDDCAVTVCCITYAHEKTIRQALDSFLMQKTNFKFKVFVGEDCGTDGTADIIREYAEKYPDVIVPFIRETNMGAQTNLIDLCNHATSPYIAFCEGDDYWIDEYKLQKQFDYMQEHEDIRMCYTGTEILAPEDWHLNSYYKHEKDGRMILPGCTPGFKERPYYTVKEFLVVFPTHTSSAFYRWNYDLDIPDWYFQGLIGDTPITLMQMGLGKAVYLPDVTSVYRRSDVGVFMNSSNTEHFANTRLDYVRFLRGLRNHFEQYYEGAYSDLFRYRITKEIANYLNTAKAYGDADMVKKLADEYPDEMFEAMHTFLGSYNIYTGLQSKLNKTTLYHLCETRRGCYFALPGLWVYSFLHNTKLKLKKAKQWFNKYFVGWRRYWKNTKVKKEKNLWVFSGFRHANYMDNVMYLYEYILENHPEINAVWLTTNKDVLNKLQEENKPVLDMQSEEGIQTMARAEIAVIDHFVMSDFSPLYGFNDNTKVVQLWHGVGFKSMGDGKSVKNTTEKGVQYSNDIIACEGDSGLTRLWKRVKYYFVAPFREKFEKYFLFICPGQERIDTMAKVWDIPMENVLMAGHPRDLPVYNEEIQKEPIKIMYAPTYRFNPKRENAMIKEFLDSAEKVQKLMEKVDGEFYLRMHPHTWRNYSAKIENVLNNYDRIFRDTSKDVYKEIGTFSIMISDYSSISMDFAILNRPVIFHCADYEWFIKNEAGFNVDYPSVIPGPMTQNWEETLKKVEEYCENPDKDKELREERCRYFFDKSVNGPDNSERIIEEIKKRISL